ncbi:mannitol dehydrogenase family protein [Marinihelvus fidelis]|uniref:Mannitol dehydrogenase family protein n=1 Tax=Marinihelvus fidelis TaxID=2613842 RepID=A0A5N0TFM0_9GAMM|nr:mannitol dehydrogenase family protein [Marinihelvus fidelis]KAA9132676.1 mannitol dehydrogenase family protein [Marinihelvus fidelis]
MTTVSRLDAGQLDGLPGSARQPCYDHNATTIGVVHLGLGAFHRAHQAVFFDDLLAAGESGWAIAGVSMRSAGVRDQLAPQDGLYTLVSLDGDQVEDRIIGAISEALFLGEERERVDELLASADTKLVTLTVTEKAYCLASLDGGLDFDHPGIVHDVAHPDTPGTVPGLLCRALARRRHEGLAPPTIMSCDNLPNNSTRLRRAILDFADRAEPGLGDWLRAEGAFPNTMVDRIVPRTTEADREALATRLGVDDHGMVKAEPFTQWVIEDRFCNGRPPLDRVGATLVDDVEPYELMKLRFVLGSHSSIAYLACLAGIKYVHDAMDTAIGDLVAQMMEHEAQPVTALPPGFDIAAYRATLLARFSNAGIMHLAAQIAMDGSQKVPIRLLGTIRACIEAGQPFDRLALAVAAWIRYASGTGLNGESFDVDDPMAAELAAIGREAGDDDKALLDGFLAVPAIFPAELSQHPAFRDSVGRWLLALTEEGALACAARAA